jgi:uncharacterized protein YegL
MNTNPSLDQAVEFADNPESRCACVILVDTSGSMAGAPIQALNEGIQKFKAETQQDALASKRLEIALVSFSSSVTVEQDFVTIDAFNPPELRASGCTAMGQGILKALDMVTGRKADYKKHGIAYYRPWIIMITDGAPTDDTSLAEQRVKDVESGRHVSFFAVGVEGAKMKKLATISVRPPVKLHGLDFASLFEWLSHSLQEVAKSQPGDQVGLAPLGWGTVQTA